MGVKLALYIEAEAHQERERMPGHFRQRIRTVISSLAGEPRPSASQPLALADIQVPRRSSSADGTAVFVANVYRASPARSASIACRSRSSSRSSSSTVGR